MSDHLHSFDLHCPGCSWSEYCGPSAMIAWLRKAKKVRPGREPEAEILAEVFRATAPQLTCPACGGKGLIASPAQDDLADWPETRLCSACRQPIPRERLVAVPDASLCAACQHDEELGRAPTEIEYCPRCGAPMELSLARSAGLTRYVMACTACRGGEARGEG